MKFVEGSRLRVRAGQVQPHRDPRTLDDDERLQAFGIEPQQRVAETARLITMLTQWPGARITPLARAIPSRDAQRSRDEDSVGHRLADLETYATLRLANADMAQTQRAIDELATLPIIELVHAAPRGTVAHRAPCFDWAPATTNLEPQQNYLNVPPTAALFGSPGVASLQSGLDARFSRNVPGGTGTGVFFIDLEDGFLFDHEDLPAIDTVVGTNIIDPSHGAASFGVVKGCSNGFGITGMAPASFARHVSPTSPTVWTQRCQR